MTAPERSMTAAELLDVAEVERLTLNPGDMLVLKSPIRLSNDERAQLAEQLRLLLPDTKVIALEAGLDISVLRVGE